MLVGYGPRDHGGQAPPAQGRDARAASAATAQQAVQTAMMTTPTPVPEPSADDAAEAAPAHAVASGSTVRGATVLAKPPVRKLAKDLGVDLTDA